MNERNWNQYKVEWHTSPGMGATYYDGTKTVWAEDEDDAHDRAQREIHRSFREYGLNHIVIDSVERMN